MIISDLNHLEVTNEADNLEGGVDFSLNLTQFSGLNSVMQSGTVSAPGGSTSTTNSLRTKIDTSAFNAIVLGL